MRKSTAPTKIFYLSGLFVRGDQVKELEIRQFSELEVQLFKGLKSE